MENQMQEPTNSGVVEEGADPQLEGVLDDGQSEGAPEGTPEGEPKGGGEAEGQEPEAKPEAFYTEEEFSQLDPFQVDPDKLPGAGSAVHKRYIQIYQQQILPELQALRQFKQQAEAQARGQGNPREAFMAEVKARTMRELGVKELDEFSAEQNIELSRQAAILQNEIASHGAAQRAQEARAQDFQRLRSELSAEIPDFERINLFANTEINNLPYAKAQKVMQDMASGDPARIRAVFKMFGERFAQQKKGGAPAVKQPTKVVPGTAGAQEPKGWDYGKFAGASSDDQARMLMDMGLVDKEES